MDDAKQLFRAFDGRFSLMAREGVLEQYRSHGVEPEIEREWAQELCEESMRAFKAGFIANSEVYRFFEIAETYGFTGELSLAFRRFQEVFHCLDTFTQLLVAELFFHAFRNLMGAGRTAPKEAAILMKELRSTIRRIGADESLSVDPRYREGLVLTESLDEETIRQRIQVLVDEAGVS